MRFGPFASGQPATENVKKVTTDESRRNAWMTGSKGSDVVSECQGRKYRETQVGGMK